MRIKYQEILLALLLLHGLPWWTISATYQTNTTSAISLTTAQVSHQDSLLAHAKSLPKLTDRIACLQSSFDPTVEYTKLFLDSALVWAKKLKNPQIEASLLFDLYIYYEAKVDSKGGELVLAKVRELAYNHPNKETLYTYFRIWAGVAQDQILSTKLEEAKFEAMKMEEEAEALNNNDGRFFSYYISAFANYKSPLKEHHELMPGYLKRAELLPDLSLLQQRWLELTYFEYYVTTDNAPMMRMHLQREAAILHRDIPNDPDRNRKLAAPLVKNYILMSKLYDYKLELDSVKSYLDKAKQYYSDDMLYTAYVNYHDGWADYYWAQEEWKKGIEHIDKAIERGKKSDPFYVLQFCVDKAGALYKMGHKKEALALYDSIVVTRDSLNCTMLESHKRAYQANYEINLLLKEQADRDRMLNALYLLALMIVLLFFAYLLLRAWKAETIVRSQRREIDRAYKEVEQSNALKEFFLKHIVTAIKRPLNSVIACSDKMSRAEELTQSDKLFYATLIRNDSQHLLNLVVNVLELSRLESGMMKFEYKALEVASFCQNIQQQLHASWEALQPPTLVYLPAADHLVVTTDSHQLQKILLNLLNPSFKQEVVGDMHWQVWADEKRLIISFYNLPLVHQLGTEAHLIHQINETLLAHLGGSYAVKEQENSKWIEIELPLHPET